MILDYNDLVKSGIIKSAEIIISDLPDRKYAVILKTASKTLNRFDITDKDSTEKSIEALKVNKDIPESIRKSAEYYVKQAAEHFGLEFDVEVSPSPRTIHFQVNEETKSTVTYPVLKIAGKSIILDDYESIKEAEEHFVRNRNLYTPTDRIEISKIIEKSASNYNCKTGSVVSAYSSPEYGSDVKILLEMRKISSFEDDEQREKLAKVNDVLDALKDSYTNIPVAEFLSLVQQIDKTAGIDAEKRNIDYYKFLTKSQVRAQVKVANEEVLSENPIINSLLMR